MYILSAVLAIVQYLLEFKFNSLLNNRVILKTMCKTSFCNLIQYSQEI